MRYKCILNSFLVPLGTVLDLKRKTKERIMDKKTAVILASLAIAGGSALAIYFIKKKKKKKMNIHFI